MISVKLHWLQIEVHNKCSQIVRIYLTTKEAGSRNFYIRILRNSVSGINKIVEVLVKTAFTKNELINKTKTKNHRKKSIFIVYILWR